MGFIAFMAGTPGRLLRVAAGLALLAVGLLLVGGTTGYVVAGVGLLPLAAGLLDICLFAPLFHAPFAGRAIRARR